MIRHLLRRHRPGHAYPDGGQRNRRIASPPPRLTPPKAYYLAGRSVTPYLVLRAYNRLGPVWATSNIA